MISTTRSCAAHAATTICPLQVFDLSTSEWGQWSPVSWASFLPILSLLCPSIPDLGSGMGETDRRTDDGHQCFMPPPQVEQHKTKRTLFTTRWKVEENPLNWGSCVTLNSTPPLQKTPYGPPPRRRLL